MCAEVQLGAFQDKVMIVLEYPVAVSLSGSHALCLGKVANNLNLLIYLHRKPQNGEAA